ncbi:hypothetical protein C462_05368 [Halorubrum distributum JCM 13916]|uniref:Uncharacterized protein n=1 Tax=Halorubrum distributum JCM 13916 TaxID=1230455 RepID=M0PSA4_9EURY|nr:hypothetical protein C462_05368 [Halorubrum arcis JCM 13916]
MCFVDLDSDLFVRLSLVNNCEVSVVRILVERLEIPFFDRSSEYFDEFVNVRRSISFTHLPSDVLDCRFYIICRRRVLFFNTVFVSNFVVYLNTVLNHRECGDL